MTKPWTTTFAAAIAAAAMLPGVARAQPTIASATPGFALVERSIVGGSGGWDYITFDADRQRLFIARGDRVQVWSARTKTIVAEIAATDGVHGVALAPDLGRGFTTNGRSNSVTVFGLDDLKTIATIAIPGRNPDAVLYEPKLKRLYTFNGRSQDATVIDAQTLGVLASIALGGKPEAAVGDGDGHVFVNIEDTAELVVIDEATGHVGSRWPLGSCREPTGLAIDPAHRRLFVACADREMVIVDADSGRLVGKVPIGGQPDGVAFDPGLGLIFSSNGEGSLTLVREVDPEHFVALATVPTQPRARTLSLDTISHRVYLATAAFGPAPAATAEQPRPRPSMLPDTFTVLVVEPK